MAQAVEVSYESNITPQRFWQLARELLYTKLYYDVSNKKYFTKRFKYPPMESSGQTDIKDGLEGASSDDGEGEEEKEEVDGEVLPCSEEEINTLLVSYLTLVSNYCDQLTDSGKDPEFFENVSKYILAYKNYRLNQTFCIRKMLSLLAYTVGSNEQNMSLDPESFDPQLREKVIQSIETNEKFIRTIGWILYSNYKSSGPDFVDVLKRYRGIEAICAVLHNYDIVSRNAKEGDPFLENYSNYMELLYQICQAEEIGPQELDAVRSKFLKFLLSKLKPETDEQNPLNYLRFRLLLALNEQYMVRQYSHEHHQDGDDTRNKLFDCLMSSNSYFQNFMETLILNFNRETNQTIQILMLKMLYVIFTTSSTCQSIYLNDLKVIVDIIIRELCNLSLTKDFSLINTYLRVLYPMLLFSNLKGHEYKVDSMRDILTYLSTTEQTNENTQRLANRCLDLDIFKKEDTKSSVDQAVPFPSPISVPRISRTRSASVSTSLPASPLSHGPPPPLPRPRHWSSADSVQQSQQRSPIQIVTRESSSSSQVSVVSGLEEGNASMGSGSDLSLNSSMSGRTRRLAPPPPPRRRLMSSSDVSLSRAKAV
ncbi:DEKNAAC100055 [Brettanomyces naardenensis]|uniref:DEKNAAC100055 n=1 Tax=Brettanomyces naardenensis TaxID=13370 RepID=A0A448YES7_BRENA|nr:DEKNAAC100055 [Brettanomyces naardenensis]